MPAASTCPHCDARIGSRHQAYCEYCGGALPGAAPTTSGEVREVDLARRFEELERHPDLPELMRHTPSTKGLAVSSGCGVAFAVVFVVIALGFTGLFGGVGAFAAGPLGALFGLPALFILGVGVVVLVFSVKNMKEVAFGPLRRVPAVVVDERTSVRSGDDDTRSSTTHYVTLELESGRRIECHAPGRVAGLVTEGDAGVAYLKSKLLVDFRRLRV